ncbi:unnamed protein product [Lampetra planeri]
MSKATKRKHVVKEVLEEFAAPMEQQQIVKVLGTPGNNLHEVETAAGEHFLVTMPTKYRKNIWIKRGDFVMVEPIEEGDKVKAEIVSILNRDHIRYLKKEGVWPVKFNDDASVEASSKTFLEPKLDCEETTCAANDEEVSDEDDSGDDDLFVNTNHVNSEYTASTDEDDSENSDVDNNDVNMSNAEKSSQQAESEEEPEQ